MAAELEILVVGRAHSGSRLDIEVPAANDTVGRRHAEITIGQNGDCHIVDLGSTNGTSVRESGKWVRITQKTLPVSSAIRLGQFETTLQALLGMRRSAAPRKPPQPPPLPVPAGGRAKPRRNPSTGEVE